MGRGGPGAGRKAQGAPVVTIATPADLVAHVAHGEHAAAVARLRQAGVLPAGVPELGAAIAHTQHHAEHTVTDHVHPEGSSVSTPKKTTITLRATRVRHGEPEEGFTLLSTLDKGGMTMAMFVSLEDDSTEAMALRFSGGASETHTAYLSADLVEEALATLQSLGEAMRDEVIDLKIDLYDMSQGAVHV